MKLTNDIKDKGLKIKQAETYIRKLQPQEHYIILYESVYRNYELSSDEKALLIELVSSAPDFKPQYKNLINKLKIEKRRLIKASKGLQEKGYLFIENHGRNGALWTITQTPIKADTLSDKDYLYEQEPSRLIEMLNNGIISREQAIKRLANYIKGIKADLCLNQEEQELLRKIINTKWIDD